MLTKDNGKDKKEVAKREETAEKLEFGEPYEKTRRHSKFDLGENLQVIPVEIEIDSLVYSLIKHKILENMRDDDVSFEEWVNICFKERMEQILTDQMEMARLQYIIISSWNNEMRRKAVDALASYGKKALPSLTNVAYSLLWTPGINQYVLDKIKQINEGAI